ncbi:MAG: UbiA family prenyltransferase [Nitrospirae bacterium]|nr:UbiA family prenyltransferase [Nitrospirota bacterium]
MSSRGWAQSPVGRVPDAVWLTGLPLMGLLASAGWTANIWTATQVGLAAFLLAAHAFWLNDRSDARFERQGAGPTRAAPPAAIVWGSAACAVGVLLSMRRSTMGYGVFVLVSAWLYSHPKIYWKGIPVVSNLLHALSGAAFFALGFVSGPGRGMEGLGLAVYFGLLFAGGHLFNEIRDREADCVAGVRTNCVRFGIEAAGRWALVEIVMGTLGLALMSVGGRVPGVWGGAGVVAAAVVVVAYRAASRAEFRPDPVRRFQRLYRAAYAGMAGVWFVAPPTLPMN